MNSRDELVRIEDQLRAGFEGPAWHGLSVLEVLDGVDERQAAARPVPAAHTIRELVLHLGGAYALVLRRLRGDATQLAPEEDWPPVPAPTAANWRPVSKISERATTPFARRCGSST